MQFAGQVKVKAPRAAVYAALRDARFFASCVEGVSELAEIGPDRYAARLETKVAYMSFKFKVTVELLGVEPEREIKARVEGVPLGLVGRLAATTRTRLDEAGDETIIDYSVE